MSAIEIGTNKEACKETIAAIMQILESGAEQETQRKALDTFSHSVSVDNMVVSYNTFNGADKKK